MDLWGDENKHEMNIASQWDNFYGVKYMEYLTVHGFSGESRTLAAGQAYEHACLTIIEKFDISFDDLDIIIRTYSAKFGTKQDSRPDPRKRHLE
ncbi:MAG: hypothetical protein GY839_03025 [candidate division Zixibacteria bacterium]|nr:hypothetical protein [candidate division Zixibacteria bacterium]